MKRLSILMTMVLLLLAHQLATRMKRAGALPAERSPVPETQISKHPAKSATFAL